MYLERVLVPLFEVWEGGWLNAASLVTMIIPVARL